MAVLAQQHRIAADEEQHFVARPGGHPVAGARHPRALLRERVAGEENRA